MGFPALDREGVRLPFVPASNRSRASRSSPCRPTTLPPLTDWFGDVCASASSRWASASLKAVGAPLVAEYPYNWKNLADNYLEGYHIPVGHPGLLRMLDYKRYQPQLGHRPQMACRAAAR